MTGAGFGVAFMGAIRSISAAAPDEQRAAVMSAFYVVAYLSLSVPTLIAGLVVPELGLEPTFRIFGSVVVRARDCVDRARGHAPAAAIVCRGRS